jgi:hypothetical protein
MAMLLTGCATSGAVTSAGYCEVAKPILISKKDELTDGTARQILAHNETWAAICGK